MADQQMNYYPLGNSTLKISEIGFGCMSLGTDPATAASLIDEAIGLGINYFDTADIYHDGVNETILGKILKGKRDNLVLATKVGNVVRSDGSGLDWNPSAAHIIKSVEKSLNRLQTDRIDLYQLHGGTIGDPLDETIATFDTLKQQGKIRYYGISSIRPNVIREYIRRSSMVSVMMQYSLLDRRPEEDILDLLLSHNIGVLSRGSVAQGLLVNKPAKPYIGHDREWVEQAAACVRSISGPQRSPAQTSIRFALQHPAVVSAVIGIRNDQQLQDAVKTIATPLLSEEEMIMLKKNAPASLYLDHRA